jgi:hypothetical protein
VRNPALEPLDVLVGEWTLTLTDAWFLESRDVRQHGHATAVPRPEADLTAVPHELHGG